ncbi:MAG: VOC family protein [Janthinobacterium lividum]
MPIPTTRKLAFQLACPDSERLQSFATTVLGAEAIYQEPGLAACQLPDGSLLEFYSPGASHPAYLFAHGPVVASFRVPDLAQAVAEALATGLQMVGGPELVCPGLSLCHLQLADGLVIGLYQEEVAETPSIL